MDKQTLSGYGWIVCVVLVISIMIGLATPFAGAVKNGVVGITNGFSGHMSAALNGIGNGGSGEDNEGSGGSGGGNGSGAEPDSGETPIITHGESQTYHKMAPSTLTFRSTAPLDELQEIQINGETIDPSNYTLKEGSTIVTLSVEYLDTLDKGDYEITIVSNSGAPSAKFAIIEPELNEHGFYYDQPYYAGDIAVGYMPEYDFYFLTGAYGFMLHPDGTATLIDFGGAEISEATATYQNGVCTISFYGISFQGAFSADGKSFIGTKTFGSFYNGESDVEFSEPGIDFVMDRELIASDDEYLYLSNSEKTSYIVMAIDKTKCSYIPVKTNILGVPVTGFAAYAFANNSNLTSFIIPDGLGFIGTSAFKGCTNLTSIVIPDSITSIDDEAFNGCSSLTNVEIPDSVSYISMNVFNGCTGLTSIVISNNVTDIGNYAFEGCTGLTNISFEGTMAEWNSITFGSSWKSNVPATYVQCSDGQVALN